MSLQSELLAHHIATIKRAAGMSLDANVYLDEMRAIIKRRVLGFDEEARTKARLQKLIEQLAKELNKPAGKLLEQLKEDLKSFARYESEYQAETIGGWVKLDLIAPTVGQVWAAAKFEPLKLGSSPVDFEKLIDTWGADEVARLVMGVKSGFVQGLTTKQIVNETIGAGGLMDIAKRNIEAVTLTSLAHVSSAARMEMYKANDDVVIGYSLLNTLDSRTTPICRTWRQDKVYKFTDKYQPRPPFHFRCRTVEIPALGEEFDFLSEGATRAAKGGPVSADTDYYDWLKRQPAAMQDEVLGKTKGMIFRNSGLSAEEFRKLSVDDLGRPLTIQQMIDRDKRVASYLRNG